MDWMPADPNLISLRVIGNNRTHVQHHPTPDRIYRTKKKTGSAVSGQCAACIWTVRHRFEESSAFSLVYCGFKGYVDTRLLDRGGGSVDKAEER